MSYKNKSRFLFNINIRKRWLSFIKQRSNKRLTEQNFAIHTLKQSYKYRNNLLKQIVYLNREYQSLIYLENEIYQNIQLLITEYQKNDNESEQNIQKDNQITEQSLDSDNEIIIQKSSKISDQSKINWCEYCNCLVLIRNCLEPIYKI